MKKITSILLAVALVISTLTISGIPTKAAESTDWSKSAITAPKEGTLVGAGYVDIKFDMTLDGAKSYEVFFDGTSKGTYTPDALTTSAKCEVYTTSVSAHKIQIEATMNDNSKVKADELTFYVSKKGLAMGGDMSDKVQMKKLNCSWYYNWALDAFNNSIDEGVGHVPMMWGAGEDNIESMSKFSTTANYILGFNEPDIETQANMYFFEGIEAWDQYIKPLKMRKIAPAPASPGGDSNWLKLFMNGGYKCMWKGEWKPYSYYEGTKEADDTKTWVAGAADDVDAVVLHYYRNTINLQGLLDAVDTLWNTYHKPIWITELSLFGMKGTSSDFSYEKPEVRAAIAKYVEGIVTELDKNPHVERYCWFSYDIDSTNDIDSFDGSGGTSMFEYSSGLYTELGRLYSNIGNPQGYKAETISDDEMHIAPTTQPETTTTAPIVTSKTVTPTTATPTTVPTKNAVKKPGKTILQKAKNIKKKSVKLTWKKLSNANKYQIQYSTNKKFKSKTVTKYSKKTSYKVSKLKNKKKYYFRVRAINAVGKGLWSKVKKVKVTK